MTVRIITYNACVGNIQEILRPELIFLDWYIMKRHRNQHQRLTEITRNLNSLINEILKDI
jgi:hypothetical protein